MEKKKTKYEYVQVIQGCYDGKNWDDCCAYGRGEKRACAADFRVYCREEPGYRHRVISRRIPKGETGA